MPREVRNVGASVRARLQNLSRETGRSFELILTRYALERLLCRLSTSVFSDRFVLKGAMLLTSWFTDPHRATRDLDLLGFGDPSPAGPRSPVPTEFSAVTMSMSASEQRRKIRFHWRVYEAERLLGLEDG
jgi:predicted nucleotidyltransferase component of viral defense system